MGWLLFGLYVGIIYILHTYPLMGMASRSEGFALTGCVVPGYVEDGAWMIWENSSAAIAAVVAHPWGVGGGGGV